MKKLLVLTGLLCGMLICNYGYAQGFKGEGDKVFQAGLAAVRYPGNYFGHLSSTGFFPPVFMSFDYGIHDYVSIGAYSYLFSRSFAGNGWVDGHWGTNWRVRETWWGIGGRAAFHLTPFLNDVARTRIPEELHLYGGVYLGLDNYFKSRNSDQRHYDSYYAGGPALGPMVGARYFFTRGFGVYAEARADIFHTVSFATIGISLKL
ncbi:MAG: hypothetical protein ACK40G_12330 [Cytophagaceae bacterium]